MEKYLGLIIVLACGYKAATSFFAAKQFKAQSHRLVAEVEATSTQNGDGVAHIVYQDRQGKQHRATVAHSITSGSKRLDQGDRVPILVHQGSGEVRKAGFLSFWFLPILYASGLVVGLIMVVRDPKVSTTYA